MTTDEIKEWISEASEWSAKISASKRKFELLEALLMREALFMGMEEGDEVFVTEYALEAEDRDGIYDITLFDLYGIYEFRVVFTSFSGEIEEMRGEKLEEIPF